MHAYRDKYIFLHTHLCLFFPPRGAQSGCLCRQQVPALPQKCLQHGQLPGPKQRGIPNLPNCVPSACGAPQPPHRPPPHPTDPLPALRAPGPQPPAQAGGLKPPDPKPGAPHAQAPTPRTLTNLNPFGTSRPLPSTAPHGPAPLTVRPRTPAAAPRHFLVPAHVSPSTPRPLRALRQWERGAGGPSAAVRAGAARRGCSGAGGRGRAPR